MTVRFLEVARQELDEAIKSTPASEPKPRKRARRSRVVMAPEPTGSCAFAPNRVLSVVLREGEDVRWIWTFGPQGQYVSGYTVISNWVRRNRIS